MKLANCKECTPIPKRTEFTYIYIYIMFKFIVVTDFSKFFY